MGAIRFLGGRLLSAFLSLFTFVSALFFLSQVLIPGDFSTRYRLGLPPSDVEEIRRQLGLDLPLWDQYVRWLGDLVRGDLGTSFFGASVGQLLGSAAAFSLFVFLGAAGLAYVFGSWLGRRTGWRSKRGLSWSTLAAVIFHTLFPPFVAFAVVRGIFSLGGLELVVAMQQLGTGFGRQPELFSILWLMVWTLIGLILLIVVARTIVVRYTRRGWPNSVSVGMIAGAAFGLWSAMGVSGETWDLITFESFPLLVMFLLTFGEITIVTQGAMSGIRNQDYVQVARAKGLSDRQVRDRHGARAALAPTLTKLMVSFPYFLVGLVIVERAIPRPGVGDVLFRAVSDQDMPVVLGSLLLIGSATILLRLVFEILYLYLDPRIRISHIGGAEHV